MDETVKNMEIICHNVRGFPNSKDNWHKLKGLQKLVAKADAVIILETRTNQNNSLIIPNEELEIGKENKMPYTANQQYQHNGSGTAIITKRNYDFKPARELFNNDK